MEAAVAAEAGGFGLGGGGAAVSAAACAAAAAAASAAAAPKKGARAASSRRARAGTRAAQLANPTLPLAIEPTCEGRARGEVLEGWWLVEEEVT